MPTIHRLPCLVLACALLGGCAFDTAEQREDPSHGATEQDPQAQPMELMFEVDAGNGATAEFYRGYWGVDVVINGAPGGELPQIPKNVVDAVDFYERLTNEEAPSELLEAMDAERKLAELGGYPTSEAFPPLLAPPTAESRERSAINLNGNGVPGTQLTGYNHSHTAATFEEHICHNVLSNANISVCNTNVTAMQNTITIFRGRALTLASYHELKVGNQVLRVTKGILPVDIIEIDLTLDRPKGYLHYSPNPAFLTLELKNAYLDKSHRSLEVELP